MPLERKVFDLFEELYGYPDYSHDLSLFPLTTIAAVTLISVVCRVIFNRIQPVVYYAVVLLLGMAMGTFIHYSFDQAYDTANDIYSNFVLELFIPFFVFNTTVGVDYHTMMRNLGHLLVLLVPGCLMEVVLLALVTYPMLYMGERWHWYNVLILCTFVTNTMSQNVIQELEKVQGQVRHVQLILQSEGMITTPTLIFSSFMLFRYSVAHENSPGGLFLYELIGWSLFGSIIGCMVGIIIRYPMRYAYGDTTSSFLLVYTAIYVTYFSAELCGMSGVVAVSCFGIMLSSTKIKVSYESENTTHTLWSLLEFLLSTVVFCLTGIVIAISDTFGSFLDLGPIILIYLANLAIRGIMVCFVHHLVRVRRFQQEKATWKHLFITVWANYKGAPALVMALYYCKLEPSYGTKILHFTTCISLISMFMHVVLIRNVFDILDMYKLNRPRIVNMNMAMAQVNACRERAIFALKMDRVISDCNWTVVEVLTRLTHPYKKIAGAGEDFGNELRIRTITCPVCHTENIAPPTKKELDDLTLEAKHRILKAELVSFWKQYEQGTLSRYGIRILANMFETAVVKEDPMLNSNDLKIQRDGTKTLICLKNFFDDLDAKTTETYFFIPRNWFRLHCFRLCTSRSTQFIIACIALVDLGIIMDIIVAWYFREYRNTFTYKAAIPYELFGIFAYALFIVEFWVQILGIGPIQYFRSNLNKIEFATSIIIRSCEVASYIDTCVGDSMLLNIFDADPTTIHLKTVLLLRVTRIYVFIVVLAVALIPKIRNLIYRQMGDDLMRSYDVGKAFLVGLDRVKKFLGHIVGNETIFNELKNTVEVDRQKVTKELGLIQKENPAIAITVKTKHAIRQVINTMGECINDMKEEGILDVIEDKHVNSSLDEVKKNLRQLTLVSPCPPDYILREIVWLAGDEESTNFFLDHAALSSYDYGDVIVHNGDDPVGLYVLVSGLVRAYYKPSPTTVQLSLKFGALPNYDFFLNLKFDQPQEDYVVAGNVIGEMGMITGRRYDMTVVCDTAVQVYFIPWIIIKAVVYDSPEAARIQQNMWKSIGVRIGTNLLQNSHYFQGWLREKIVMYLERGIVPVLANIHVLTINQMVEDILLIEGVIMDGNSHNVYYAPHYIPRSVSKIYLPDHNSWDYQTVYETKLLIIPTVGVNINVLLSNDGLFQEDLAAKREKMKKSVKENHRSVTFQEEAPQMPDPSTESSSVVEVPEDGIQDHNGDDSVSDQNIIQRTRSVKIKFDNEDASPGTDQPVAAEIENSGVPTRTPSQTSMERQPDSDKKP